MLIMAASIREQSANGSNAIILTWGLIRRVDLSELYEANTIPLKVWISNDLSSILVLTMAVIVPTH